MVVPKQQDRTKARPNDILRIQVSRNIMLAILPNDPRHYTHWKPIEWMILKLFDFGLHFSSFPFENVFLWLLAFFFFNYHQDLPISKRCGWISKRCDCNFEWCLNRFKTMKNEDLMQTVKWRLNCFLSDSQKTSVWRIMMRFCLTKSICIWLIFPLIVWHFLHVMMF